MMVLLHSTATPPVYPFRTRSIIPCFQRVPDFNPPVDGYKRFVFPDGKGVYDGHWREYKRHGQGSFAFSNGDVYEGGSGRCLLQTKQSDHPEWRLSSCRLGGRLVVRKIRS